MEVDGTSCRSGGGPPVVQAVELYAAVACAMTSEAWSEGGDVPLRLADSAKQSAAASVAWSVVLVQAPPTVSVHV